MVVEEILESVLEHARFHLITNIYSEMDPSYRYAPLEQEEEMPSEFIIHVGGRISKQKGGRAKKGFSLNRWDLTLLYFKLAELLESLSILVKSCVLTDTLVLQLSALALKPFFVENNSTLQLSALKLARNIFSKYPKHRHLLLDEIFQSLAKLPSNKRALRTYYLEPQTDGGEDPQGGSIQMVTALVMQLLQSIATVPRERSHLETDELISGLSLDAHLIGSIDEIVKTGQSFLTTLFKKCYATAPSKSEVDFRPIFENFVQDLITTLLLPHWPVSSTLLSIMCRLFLMTFTNKQAELSMRLAALEHVGNIISQCRSQMSENHTSSSPSYSPADEDISVIGKLLKSVPLEVKSKVLSSLQMKECMEIETDTEYEIKALVSFLLLLYLKEREEDSSIVSFWVGSWVRDLAASTEKEKTADLDDCQLVSPGISSAREQAFREFYLRLLTDTDPFKSASKICYKVTSQTATSLVRFLTANLSLLQNFSFYLNHLIRMVNETNVQLRTRAMKSLTSVLSVDPTLIGSSDLKTWVRTRMCDMSSMVRETTVELVGRSLQQRPELATEFYDILSERMLDTSIAVRKRVIRILRDSIHKMPPAVHTDLCVKLVMRVQEEKSVQQLIVGMFQDLWFSPLSSCNKEEEKKRAQSIYNVVFALDEPPGFTMVQELLTLLLKPDGIVDQQKRNLCRKITDSLVESILQLDEQGASLAKMIPMNATLHVLSLIDGSLLVSHLTALQPYLASHCTTQGELIGLTHLLRAFSNSIPLLVSHKPGPQFLASTEENLMKLSMASGSMIVEASLSCLAALVNSVTHNFKLVQECFCKFSECLERSHSMLLSNSSQLAQLKPIILRSLFTVGLLCRYFEIDTIIAKQKDGILPTRRVFSKLIYFAKQDIFPECQEKSLVGLGFFFLAHPSLMLEDEAIELYSECLSDVCVSKKCQVLTNLTNHLQEDEERLKRADKEWKKDGNDEGTLQDIGDKQSTLSSTMIQRFLPYVMNAFFTAEVRVRSHITGLLSMVLRQGLIYPAPCIPCLIAMVTDCNQAIREKAELMLEEMNHSNKLMHTQVVLGIRRSFDFLEILSSGVGLIRGREGMESKLFPVYNMVHNNRQQRRAFLLTMVRLFDDVDKQGIPFLLYVADNLACFNYSLLGEVLFVIHHISVHLSMAGPTLIDSFQESMGLKALSSQQGQQALDESAMLDTESLLRSEFCDDSRLATSVYHSYAIMLLLHLSSFLKSIYCLTDVRCHEYIPTAPSKVYDKLISRKLTPNLQFEPVEVVEALELSQDAKLVLRSRNELLQRFQEFYKLYKAIEVDGGESLPETYQTTYQSYTELFGETSELSEPGHNKQIPKDNQMKAPKKKSSKTNKNNTGGKHISTPNPKEKRKSIRSKRKFNYFESSEDSNCGSSTNEDM
ncbi:Nipped-B-like protein [Oopsacas minuta]|uniref:Nipped-B protein n=1 Tax=Oopsacas minuta TaxID=111878 RepID=A0AAV7JTK3_9METZ|nr:Nipped-B-like protein [Oopsacas minuta]